jgi:D-3-phosphoglycerate dehydrogenase
MESVKIHANDGIDSSALHLLEKKGYKVSTDKLSSDQLPVFLQKEKIQVLIVRSATQVRKDLMDACPELKIIARAGVGTDNIDVDYAKSKGIEVINTPAASSRSVAELVMAHLFSVFRYLHLSHREMPLQGQKNFNELKKKYSAGREVYGKTIGIIGFGRIGQQVASMALGLGMKVIASDPFVTAADIEIPVHGLKPSPKVEIKTIPLQELFPQSDIITLHVPGSKLIGEKEILQMKKGVVIINASRGGVVDEKALLNALHSGQVSHACLDVFENEPYPDESIIQHERISASPHIGASTIEAQERIGVELAGKIIDILQKKHA